MKKTLLAAVVAAAGIGFASPSPASAAYTTPIVIGQSLDAEGNASNVYMVAQGFSSTDVQIMTETHIDDAANPDIQRTWGGVMTDGFTVANYSGTDTYAVDDQDVATLADSAGSGTLFTTSSALEFGPAAGSFDQSGGDIVLGISGGGYSAYTLDGDPDTPTSGQAYATSGSTVQLLSSNNVTGTVSASDGSYASNGNVQIWTGTWDSDANTYNNID